MQHAELTGRKLKPTWRWGGVISPLVGAAVHDGHETRPEILQRFSLDDAARLREEDPFTADMARALPRHVVGLHSRFELDLNRARDKAVYRAPADAWGLNVWKTELEDEHAQNSLAVYDAFYAEAKIELEKVRASFGNFVVYDLHSYNHRRDGADAAPAPSDENPEVNIGTKTLRDPKFRPLIERFMADLRAFDFGGRQLDVRENVKFGGGQFSKWVHDEFPQNACSIAIEWKKFWMDEWSGQPDNAQRELIRLALISTFDGAREELSKLGERLKDKG